VEGWGGQEAIWKGTGQAGVTCAATLFPVEGDSPATTSLSKFFPLFCY